jgi:hypothetical protein
MMALFDLRVWMGIAIAALVALVGVQQARVSNAKAATAAVRAELASDRATYAQAAQIAEQTARAEETRREAEKQEVINAARKQTEVAVAAARTADVAAVGLRRQLAAYVAAVRGATSNPGPAGGSPPADTALDLFADLLQRSDSATGELARFADASRVAGLACERFVDRLQPPAGQAPP